MPLIECIPNVSEGRRLDVVDALARALSIEPGLHLLDYSADASHNRSVFTAAGTASELRRAVSSLYECAIPRIDMRRHRGVHPRIGAVDVVPFVPLDGATLDDCVRLAREVGAEIAARYGVPVFLYEAAATHASRRRLEHVRRGQFEGLARRMTDPSWTPDFGPARPHPTAGATAVGARHALIAYNVNLASGRIEDARAVAAAVRESSGGLPSLKAMGVRLDAGIVQVSMNLTDYRRTSLRQAFDAVASEAARRGLRVLDSEIVGLVPADALAGIDPADLLVRDFTRDRILEYRLRASEASRS